MLQLFPLLLVAIILAADSGLGVGRGASAGWAAVAAIGPVLGLLVIAAAALKWCEIRLVRTRTPRVILVADRITAGARWALVVVHGAAVLAGGWLDAVRATIGDLVLVDEIVAMLPPLCGAVGLWWLYYPIERRLREALVVRRLDHGRPLHEIPSRGRYVLEQARLHLLLMLVPITLILGLAEIVRFALPGLAPDAPPWCGDLATFAIGLLVFVFAPLLARIVLRVEPMPEGEVRDDLLAICRAHGVRVRDILLWRTDGGMINAAVMGLVGPLRFVLLTDALIETLARPQVLAVMAHEIGHVRRHHMPWLVTALLAILVAASALVALPVLFADRWGIRLDASSVDWVQGSATCAAGALAIVVFGWVSRRFERQADTFAVQHLSRIDEPEATADGVAVPEGDGRVRADAGRVRADAVWAMHSALQAIARMSAIDPHRRSWRHGSIAWRQEHLAALVGRPLDGLVIDRVIRRLKVGTAVAFLLGVLALGAAEWHAARQRAGGGPAASAMPREVGAGVLP